MLLLLYSLWRAVGTMSEIGSKNMGNNSEMERNTRALLEHIRLNKGSSTSNKKSGGQSTEEVVRLNDFVEWATKVIGKFQPKHLPELLFKVRDRKKEIISDF